MSPSSTSKWNVIVTWSYQLELREISKTTYGPYDKKWKAILAGWFYCVTIWPSCGTFSEYTVEKA